MPITSQQKKYIKKNLKNFTVSQLSEKLDISYQELDAYLKKRLDKDRYGKIIAKNDSPSFESTRDPKNPARFNFKSFVADNINIFILLFAVIFIVYFNSLGNGFVSDDIGSILKNPDINNPKVVFSLGSGFIQKIVLYIVFSLFGDNPTYFRIFNILFHFGSTLVIFSILNILTKKRIVALFSAIIFAVHPILIESVAWISGMPYVIYSFFLLLSFLLYMLSKNNRKLYWISLALFILAVNSSEKAIVFFFILVAYEISIGSIKNNWKRLIPYFLLNLVLIINFAGKIGYRINALETVHYQGSGGMYNPLVQIPIAIASYLRLIFWPNKLTLYHTEMSFTQAEYIFALLIFLIFITAVLYFYKKNKPVFFWLAFFVITLIPTITPLKIAWIVAERYVYLGALGIIVPAAMLFSKIAENEKYKKTVYIGFSIIVLSLSIRTVVRNIDWRNEDNLWIATAKTSPSGPNIHNNLGDVYGRQGNQEKAVEEFKKAIEINPMYADAYHNLANTYQKMGKLDEAIENYQKAIEFNSNLWQSYQNLASVYFSQGDYEKAYEYMKK
ncbi:MAG: tetratricopeptide repeat protein, partial [bacterium]|nr:tetratricopeptide repeat protein [bacterium]